jgi:hypothetical protein
VSDLEIGTVANISGIAAKSVWVRVKDDMFVSKAVSATGTDRNTLVLASGAKFTNATGLGQGALSAPNGRWLVYDINPLNDLDRMAGLMSDFRLFNRTYDNNLPVGVTENGNGYLSTTPELNPEQYVRVVKGADSNAANSGANTGVVNQVITSASPVTVTVVPVLQPLTVPTTGTSTPLLASNTGTNATLTAPIQLNVSVGKGFSSALQPIVGDASVTAVTVNGQSTLPAWMNWNPESMMLSSAQVPAGTTPMTVSVTVRDNVTGATRQLDMIVNPNTQ